MTCVWSVKEGTDFSPFLTMLIFLHTRGRGVTCTRIWVQDSVMLSSLRHSPKAEVTGKTTRQDKNKDCIIIPHKISHNLMCIVCIKKLKCGRVAHVTVSQ